MRPASAADLAWLVDLDEELFGLDAWSPDALAVAVASGDVLVDDEHRGYAILTTVADIADLMRIAVGPDTRRRGLGRELLSGALSKARTDGAARVLLEVAPSNEPALALYASAGFVQIDVRPRYYRDGADALVLALTL